MHARSTLEMPSVFQLFMCVRRRVTPHYSVEVYATRSKHDRLLLVYKKHHVVHILCVDVTDAPRAFSLTQLRTGAREGFSNRCRQPTASGENGQIGPELATETSGSPSQSGEDNMLKIRNRC